MWHILIWSILKYYALAFLHTLRPIVFGRCILRWTLKSFLLCLVVLIELASIFIAVVVTLLIYAILMSPGVLLVRRYSPVMLTHASPVWSNWLSKMM